MKVIIIKKNSNNKTKGKIVNVSNGYARNYLIKNGYAIIAKKKNIEFLNERRKYFLNEYKLYIKNLKKKLKNVKIEIFCKTEQTGKIFGSIGRRYLSKIFYEKYGLKINKNQININKNIIKEFGEYKIKLYEKININIKINENNK